MRIFQWEFGGRRKENNQEVAMRIKEHHLEELSSGNKNSYNQRLQGMLCPRGRLGLE
jgi:hypothetical protein